MLYWIGLVIGGLIGTFVSLIVGLVILRVWQQNRNMKRFHQQLREHSQRQSASQRLRDLLDAPDETPDSPIHFGRRMIWLAVSTDDAQALVQALKMESVKVANWKSGFVAAYSGGAFVTPPVQGWSLVASRKLPDPSAPESSASSLLEMLSTRFGSAQLFVTWVNYGCVGWMRYEQGQELRAYCWLGETGEVLYSRGELTDAESALGFCLDPVSDSRAPDEDDVFTVARAWSIDPNTLDSIEAVSLGVIGVLPNPT